MIFRRNFLSLVLLAPLAKLVAPFRSEPTFTPINLKYRKIMGTMEITPEAYAALRAPGKTEFNARTREILVEYYGRRMEELIRLENGMLDAFTASGR